MAQNDFVAFATAAGSNVETQTQWLTDTGSGGALEKGFASGLVKSQQMNKALRQGSVMAAMLGQVIAALGNAPALDDGDISALVDGFQKAIQAIIVTAFSTRATAGNGYQKLPGGIFLQWGAVNAAAYGASISFPIAFPSQCWAIVATPTASADGATGSITLTFPTVTAAAFTAKPKASITGNAVEASYYWFAVGV